MRFEQGRLILKPMSYNPEIHHRRSIRLKGYDYSQEGLYFITICCEDRACRFGKIDAGAGSASTQMILNEYGQIAYHEWAKLTKRFSNFELDVFQIMPNHMHGIIILNDVGAGFTPAQNTTKYTPAQNTAEKPESQQLIESETRQSQKLIESETGQPQQLIKTGQPQGIAPTGNATIGDIVGAYKSLVANGCLDICKSKNEMMGKFWQRNYYEYIIRSSDEYERIANYIVNNPAKWREDKFFKP